LVAGGAVDSDGVLIASFASVFFSDLAVAMYVPCTIRAHRGATQHGGPTLQSFTPQLHRAARRKTLSISSLPQIFTEFVKFCTALTDTDI